MELPEIVKNPSFVWLVVGLALILLEFTAPGLIFVFFGVSACLTAALLLFLDLAVAWQIIVFSALSVTFLFFFRKRFMALNTTTKSEADAFIGMEVVVTMAIPRSGYGRVTFKGAEWKARSSDGNEINKGRLAEIIKHESIVLFVKEKK